MYMWNRLHFDSVVLGLVPSYTNIYILTAVFTSCDIPSLHRNKAKNLSFTIHMCFVQENETSELC